MIEQDTIKLLRECDSGVKMGVESINSVMDHVKDKEFRFILNESKDRHSRLDSEIREQLDRFGDDGKDPSVMVKGMSAVKTNFMLGIKDTDKTVADLMTDGCNMGVKSLNRYLNQYEAADEVSKDIAKKLINLEEKLAVDIRQFL
ncbi:MAG: hypothetical protein IKV54_00040 [Clostridia bacterium]|nr:hypothetical protein [Clostridia bacterium]